MSFFLAMSHRAPVRLTHPRTRQGRPFSTYPPRAAENEVRFVCLFLSVGEAPRARGDADSRTTVDREPV